MEQNEETKIFGHKTNAVCVYGKVMIIIFVSDTVNLVA